MLFCMYLALSFITSAAAMEVYTPAELYVKKGTTGTLSCSFRSTEVISSHTSVLWSFIPEGSPESTGLSFFYYSGGSAFPGSTQFKPRVQWAGDLNKRDASIRIAEMQFTDNGTYSCDVKNPPDVTLKPSQTKVWVEETFPEIFCQAVSPK